MNRWMLVATLMFLGNAHAEMDYFWEHDLQSCRMYQLKKKSYEFCAISTPAGEKARTFSMTVRDPSELDTKSKSGRALQEAKHKLVAEQAIQVEPDEYVIYARTVPLNLNEDTWLIMVPIVKGTPDDFDVARGLIYLFDGKKFSMVAQVPVCEPKCKDQSVQMMSSANSPKKKVSVIQKTKDGSKNVDFAWDGKKLTQ